MARKSRFWDLAIILLAVAVRVAAVLVLRSYDVPRSTYEHGEIAANLLAGRGFTMQFLGAEGPTSQQAPVYPLLVTLVYAATHVQVASLGTALLVWTLAWAYQTGATGRPADAVITGGWLALLALTDPILSMTIIGIAGAIW